MVILVGPRRSFHPFPQAAPQADFLDQGTLSGVSEGIKRGPVEKSKWVLPVVFLLLILGGVVDQLGQKNFRGAAGGYLDVGPVVALLVGVEPVGVAPHVRRPGGAQDDSYHPGGNLVDIDAARVQGVGEDVALPVNYVHRILDFLSTGLGVVGTEKIIVWGIRKGNALHQPQGRLRRLGVELPEGTM